MYKKSAEVAEKMQIQFVQNRMDELKITLNKLASITEIDQSELKDWFNNKGIAHQKFLQICGALELRPYLIPAELDDNEIINQHFN